ncbi:MAG: hypothetical protein MH321_11465 [Leptospiraceae bacterium]|nr:hypothetical protein [Leptospiraceae bacterium]
MRVIKETNKQSSSQFYSKANINLQKCKAFIPSSHKLTSPQSSSTKSARPEQKPLDHTAFSSPTPLGVTLPKTNSREAKSKSRKLNNKRAGFTSPSASSKVTTDKADTITKNETKQQPKKQPALNTSSPTSKSKAEANTSPAPKKTTTSVSSTTSDTLKSKKKKAAKPQVKSKAHSKNSPVSSNINLSNSNTLGSNDSQCKFSFQSSGNDNSRPYKNLPTHPLENETVEKHYALLTLSILKSLFNKDCDCEKPSLLFFKVRSRPTVARCCSCHKQVSITANTPLHKFQLPLGYFSYILHDAILQYPKVITSSEISRKLNLPYKTAYFLKRRLQVVTSMLNSKLRENLKLELTQYVEANPIDLPKGEDLRPLLEDYPVASADAVVLYSSSVKANKYRSRRFRTGSSSIYRSNNLGGEQVGTLVHTIGVKGSYTFYKSIPLTKQEYLLDDLDSVIPRSIPLFTDEGYKFIWDRKNHRMVNHSKRSKDPRYNMSRGKYLNNCVSLLRQ